jgi:hypothetical protein
MSLLFLAPLSFLGLIALSVPLYLHLRHRPKGMVVAFSAMSFLLSAQQKRRKRERVENKWLLLLRLLTLSLLVLLFARPFLQSAWFNRNEEAPIVLLLDNSASMAGRPRESEHLQQHPTLFAKAKEEAQELCQQTGAAGKFSLLTTQAGQGMPDLDLAGILSALNRLSLTAEHHDLSARLDEVMTLVQNRQWPEVRVHVFSDHLVLTPAQEAFFAQASRALVMHLQEGDPHNARLASVSLESGREGHRVLAQVSADQGEHPRLAVRLRQQQRIHQEVVLALNPTQRHAVSLDCPTDGDPWLSVSLSQDSFSWDNHGWLHAPSGGLPRILIVDGDPRPEQEWSESYFMYQALQGLWSEDLNENSESISVVTASGVTRERLSEADFIIVLNVAAPPFSRWPSEASVLVAGGDLMSMDAWQPLLAQKGLRLWERVTVSQPVPVINGESMADSSWMEDEWADASCVSYHLVTVEDPSWRVPLVLEDRTPLLFVRPGLAFFASSLDLGDNNLALQPAFLLWLQRVMDEVSGREATMQLEELTVDEALRRQKSGQRFSPLERLDLGLSWAEETLLPGLYRVEQDSSGNDASYVVLTIDEGERPRDQTEPPQETAVRSPVVQQASRLGLSAWLFYVLALVVVMETLLASKQALVSRVNS